jgi:hypothetical protein
MGWASRCRTGLWARTQQAYRRERLAHNILPRLIVNQLLHLGVALVTLPWRIVKLVRRNHGV